MTPGETEAQTSWAARLFAFHLPQYHPTPENDQWWGKGFTEWTTVTRARPRFRGHVQPRLPADLGFYDLRLPEAREAQAALAREHGISGFCYYHYWFHGRRVLDRPVREMLAGGPDFPFLLCWANENWTRAWDGSERQILIPERYSPEDDRAHIDHLLDVFEDDRYVRIDGKPIFLVYRVSHLPDPMRTTTAWREAAARRGFPGLWLCRVDRTDTETLGPPSQDGFDAAVDFQPGLRLGQLPVTRSVLASAAGRATARRWVPRVTVYDYEGRVRRIEERQAPDYRRYPCVFPDWDNTPRRARGAMAFRGSTPRAYGAWLSRTVDRLQAEAPSQRVAFVNAWNEWGEGCYLEPDQRWGRQYLEATAAALQRRETPAGTGAL